MTQYRMPDQVGLIKYKLIFDAILVKTRFVTLLKLIGISAWFNRKNVKEVSNENPNFKKERKQTDDSLTIERGKTDESFISGRGHTYVNTDEVVSKNRIAADQERSERRSKEDLTRDTKNVSSSPKEDLITDDLGLTLADQRKSEDNAIENERTDMDLALEFERGEKERLMNKLVSLEREATDKNLKGERNITDLATKRSAGLFDVEHAAHMRTQSALTTREEFIAIVSHDLRNPVGAILSSTEILLEENSGIELGKDAKNLIELIKRNAQTSLRLISDILDMERIVDGKIQLQYTKSKIREQIDHTVQSFSHVAVAKNISLTVSISDCDYLISCDHDRIGQVLSNLIGNALKFTPKNGTVAVKATGTGGNVTVSIVDTGPGIRTDQRVRIFERFAQLHNVDRSGIGLGLYISKTLIELHSGQIGVDSVVGAGSTFWFTLPTTH